MLMVFAILYPCDRTDLERWSTKLARAPAVQRAASVEIVPAKKKDMPIHMNSNHNRKRIHTITTATGSRTWILPSSITGSVINLL